MDNEDNSKDDTNSEVIYEGDRLCAIKSVNCENIGKNDDKLIPIETFFISNKVKLTKIFFLLYKIMERQKNRWRSKVTSKTFIRTIDSSIQLSHIRRVLSNDKIDSYKPFFIYINNLNFDIMMKCFLIPRNSTDEEKKDIKNDKKNFESLLAGINDLKNVVDKLFNCKKKLTVQSVKNINNNNNNK
jgi:hypothetical protein